MVSSSFTRNGGVLYGEIFVHTVCHTPYKGYTRKYFVISTATLLEVESTDDVSNYMHVLYSFTMYR